MGEMLKFIVEWLPLIVGVAALAVAYVAWGRRVLAVRASHARLISKPHDGLDLVVTHDGQVVDRPLYLVHMALKCAGNRDIAMAADGEFIELETPPGTEFVTVRYGAPGKLNLTSLDRNPTSIRFKFDLLKVRESLPLNLFVKSDRDLDNVPLDGLFPVTAHIKDVRLIRQSQDREELWGGALAFLLFAGGLLAFMIYTAFSPTKPDDLLLDEAGRRVSLGDLNGTKIEVCLATTSTWLPASCVMRPIASVSSFKPAPLDGASYYTDKAEPQSRLVGMALVVIFLGVAVFGDRIIGAVRRRLKVRAQIRDIQRKQ